MFVTKINLSVGFEETRLILRIAIILYLHIILHVYAIIKFIINVQNDANLFSIFTDFTVCVEMGKTAQILRKNK